MELLVAPVKPLEAASIEPVPAVVVTERSVHVATPAEAVFDRLLALANVPHVAPASFDSVIESVARLQILPLLSSSVTDTVPRDAPKAAFAGWAVKTTFVGAHVIAKALLVTGEIVASVLFVARMVQDADKPVIPRPLNVATPVCELVVTVVVPVRVPHDDVNAIWSAATGFTVSVTTGLNVLPD